MFGIIERVLFPERPGRVLSGLILPYAAVIAALLYAVVTAAALVISPARGATPASPYILIIAKDAVLYAPDGTRFYVPVGTEIEMCSDSEPEPRLMHYQMDAHAMVIPEPCVERPLFADGFES